MTEFRRCAKILRVSERLTVSLFGNTKAIDWDAMDLPEDVVLHGVWHNPRSQAWDIILVHPSFDEVPLGEEFPVILPVQALPVKDVIHEPA